MAKILYNDSTSDVEVTSLGFTVQAYNDYNFTNKSAEQFANSDELLNLLAAGTLSLEKVNDPLEYYTPAEAVRIISLTSLASKVDSEGRQIITTDSTNKAGVHSSPKPSMDVAYTYFTGTGDNITQSDGDLSFDNTGTIGFIYTSSTGIIQYSSTIDLSNAKRKHIFYDGADNKFEVLMVDDTNNRIAIDKNLTINNTVATSNHGKIEYSLYGNGSMACFNLTTTDYRILKTIEFKEDLVNGFKSWIHSAFIFWTNAPRGSSLTAILRGKATSMQEAANLDYNIDSEGRIIATIPGTGTHGLNTATPTFVKKLNYIPSDGLAYWDLVDNNAVFKAAGDGTYNWFNKDIRAVRFVNNLCIRGTNNTKLESYDVEYIPGNYVIDISVYNSDGISPNDPLAVFDVSIWLTMFKGKTISFVES